MKTVGDIVKAITRMESLTRKLDDSEQQLTRAMFPDERNKLQEKRTKWAEEYAALAAEPLLVATVVPAQVQKK